MERFVLTVEHAHGLADAASRSYIGYRSIDHSDINQAGRAGREIAVVFDGRKAFLSFHLSPRGLVPEKINVFSGKARAYLAANGIKAVSA